ncbi:helix-turn-helix domain-containing protein [Ketobacter sp. MCCC 1A13808]|uniref:IclR family transcriptional regulator n=1 Tax=Ketobacter sp. MCCC 1A13808 TaxID=2602738 RepID=UPI0012EBE023|nr:helix-turn-helix domain-containing protein [Ketobacter sp. MCCC 1A13808]MVF12132.1 helix-turn-helix domain-containing protein [Ketobacter sp. MCCC 1A13808]
MRGATSGPTSRTLDVLELLARSPSTGIRYVDIVRQLGLNQGTAHTILKTLVDRGWVIRDPGDKTFTLGPAIAAIGAQFDQTRPLLHAARIAAKRLSEELGFSASVVELVNEELVVSAVYPGEYGEAVPQPGTKVPYVPPYGAIFAGFAPEPERVAWLNRATSQSQEVQDALERTLALTQERGYDVDWTTPAVAKITAMADSLADLHPSLLSAMDQVLMELTALSFDEIDTDRSVTSIIAPVLDQPGYARLGIAIHPLRPLPIQKIQACGRRLVEEGKKILDLPVPG